MALKRIPGSNIIETANGNVPTPIDVQTASASATIELTLASGFSNYIIYVDGLVPATDNIGLFLRLSNDGGSTFRSGASDYAWSEFVGTSNLTDSADSEIEIVATGHGTKIGNVSGENYGGYIKLFGARNSSVFTLVNWTGGYINGTAIGVNRGNGHVTVAEENDAVRLLMESGNITSGTFTLLGLN